MKRIIFVLLVMIVFFTGCSKERSEDITADSVFKASSASQAQTEEQESTSSSPTRLEAENYVPYTGSDTQETVREQTEKEEGLFVASWLSYLELSLKEGRSTKEEYTEYIDGIFDNMLKVNVTDVFVQVRPFADAFYSSSLFPSSAYAAGGQGEELPFDALALIISRAKEKNLRVHAWINPYRVSSSSDIEALCESNPARVWYEEGNNETVVVTDNGIYFNPASRKVKNLIIDGAREILESYEVAGIHIDDYFYFDGCEDFDEKQYGEYLSSGGQLTLESWRRENVSSLLSSLYIAVKAYGEDKIFSVSPSGNISSCYNEGYADVYLWCREEGYCDMIMPQIYFGFENEKLPFKDCLTQWETLCRESQVKLCPGLALYKVGKEDTYALSGKNEWIENSDIIARQVQCIKSSGCYGYALYSGGYIDFTQENLSEELNNLKSVAQ